MMSKEPSLIELIKIARITSANKASIAWLILLEWFDKPFVGVPGISTRDRLAVRIHTSQCSAEQAASAEYLYRWRLALQSRVFGVPHAIGM